MRELKGRAVIEELAEIYRQLYLKPGEEGQKEYPDIVRRGMEPDVKDLSHFISDERDQLTFEITPAGIVLVIVFYKREDFITFLQIMGNKCAPIEIKDSQGASLLDGVINWNKINSHREEFFRSEMEKGNIIPDWASEFKRFTSDDSNYLDTLIVLSVGAYSAISADRVGYGEEEWLDLSHKIRMFHECTHFMCRKRYPEKIDAVWDELVADSVGIYGAFGRFDKDMAKLFLGVRDGRYVGGRLANYVKADTEEEKEQILQGLAARVEIILEEFAKIIDGHPGAGPFEVAEILEATKERLYD
ncbi:MAG: hypothetical protein IK152_00060 [Lachnospiraceae bacterium]|nr:hypothetical protein [Lachnospiraceae bacterium]